MPKLILPVEHASTLAKELIDTQDDMGTVAVIMEHVIGLDCATIDYDSDNDALVINVSDEDAANLLAEDRQKRYNVKVMPDAS